MIKAFEDLVFTKEQFETWVSEDGSSVVTKKQWEKIVDDLDGRVHNFLDNLIYDVVVDFREGVYDE